MLLVDDPTTLWRHRDSYDLRGLLLANLRHVHGLQYLNGAEIAEASNYLRGQLREYANQHSPAYRDRPGIVSKRDLQNKTDWYVEGVPFQAASTSGSTGTHFHYRRWAESFQTIEANLHYRAILHEYQIKCQNLVYLMLDQPVTPKAIRTHQTNNLVMSHGLRTAVTVHEFSRSPLYYKDSNRFWGEIITYCQELNPEVILIRGDLLATFRWNCERLGVATPLCQLLSHTGAKARLDDFTTLHKMGAIGQWCDHMRCWDGGVTFFTCPYRTYHLLDGLAAVSTDDHRLVSTDFYSLASPFIDYWNGDFATIGAEYERCQCGRSYRSLDRSRSRLLTGVTNTEIRQRIIESGVDTSLLLRGEARDRFLRLFTSRQLPQVQRETIRRLLPDLVLDFVVEQ